MAIIFTTGTINQPDAGSVGMSVHNMLRDNLVAHPAWELVEEFTPASGTVEWIVLRCLATESGLPDDFYVVIGRRLSDGRIEFYICEDYVLGTHTMSNFHPYVNNSPLKAYDAEGRWPDTYVLTTAFPTSVVTSPMNQNHWTPSGTNTKWWLCAAEDGFTVAFNGASNGFVHIGAFTPLTDLAWPMPIQIISSNGSGGGVTRNPALGGANWHAYGLYLENSGGSTSLSNVYRLGFAGDARYNDDLQNGERTVAEVGITMYTYQDGDEAISGWAVGKQKRMRYAGGQSPLGFAFGDAYALEGRLWVPYLPTDTRIWDTGVASA